MVSIERGGLFTELRKAHGAAEITEVMRQKVDRQREAAHDLAEGRLDSAVAAYDLHGAITWTTDGEAAREALVARWKADTLELFPIRLGHMHRSLLQRDSCGTR